MKYLLSLGTSHHLADTSARSRLALSPAGVRECVSLATRTSAIDEALVLSTCNRVECYVIGADLAAAERAIREVFTRLVGDDLLAPGPLVQRREGADSALHLCRVACGLESMLVGEAEILGQLQGAAAIAREAGAIGPDLEELVHVAVQAGRRARIETRIAVGATSVAGAAVTLAERTLGTLSGRAALVIGAGHAARLATSRIAKRRPGHLVVANRSLDPARALAHRFDADACALQDLAPAMAGVDVVIAAVQTLEPVLTADLVRSAMAGRAQRPLVIVDISVPPTAEPAVSDVPGVSLMGIDDLRAIQDETETQRRREVPFVEAIALEEASKWIFQMERRASARQLHPLEPSCPIDV